VCVCEREREREREREYVYRPLITPVDRVENVAILARKVEPRGEVDFFKISTPYGKA